MRALFLALVLAQPSLSLADEVVQFRPRPAAVESDGDTFVGILISEEEFTKIIGDKLRSQAERDICSVDRSVCAETQKIYLLELEKLRHEIIKSNSWFRRNKGSLGLITGLVIGVATSIGIARAINGE